MSEANRGELNPEEAGEVVRVLGTIFSNSFLYGPQHGVTTKAVKDAFAVLGVVFGRGAELSVNLADDELIVNGMTLEQKNPLMRMFATHLQDLEISSFTISNELDWESFLKLVEVLNQKPDVMKASGGLAQCVSALGIKGIATKTVVYKAVTEDDEIVNKEKIEEVAKGLAAVGSGKAGDGEGEGEPGPMDEKASQTILAFLKGDVDASDKSLEKSVSAAANDASKLSELILQAAEIQRETAQIDGGESLSNMVVGCLRKTYDVLSQNKTSKTQKGKKNLHKMLMLVEKEILEKMRSMSEGVDFDSDFFSEAIEEMEDEIKIDSLATDYMKKRNAIDSNEKKLLRFIKTKGLDKIEDTDLKDRLFEGGLDAAGWRELLVRSGAEGGGGGGGGGVPGIPGGGGLEVMGHLAVLLHQMENSIAQAKEGSGGVAGLDKVAEGVQKEIRGLVAKTEKKIFDLVDDMQKENAAEAIGQPVPEGKRMSRKRLMEILAEIAQELCQPLAVINCSVDMIRGGSLGEVAAAQVEMLSLASESGAKLQQLINKLMQISGVPDTRSPDASIQQSLYT